MASHRVRIDRITGEATVVYSDEIRPVLAALGPVTIARASHVEPNGDGKWEADLSPSGGPKLGPFDDHAAAIAAELAWLREHKFSPQS